jgi:hypothetical protein
VKIYIATRFNRKKEVQKLIKLLKGKDHQIVADWTNHPPIKPYQESQNLSEEFSVLAVNGIKNSDIFILLSDQGGTGMYAELGLAIGNYIQSGKPKIFVVGDYNSRSMFFYHPSVTRLSNIKQLIAKL